MGDPDAIERACIVMHDAYEEAAAREGWATQERSRVPWAEVPVENKATMRAAVTALLTHLALPGVVFAADDSVLSAVRLRIVKAIVGMPAASTGQSEVRIQLVHAEKIADAMILATRADRRDPLIREVIRHRLFWESGSADCACGWSIAYEARPDSETAYGEHVAAAIRAMLAEEAALTIAESGPRDD